MVGSKMFCISYFAITFVPETGKLEVPVNGKRNAGQKGSTV